MDQKSGTLSEAEELFKTLGQTIKNELDEKWYSAEVTYTVKEGEGVDTGSFNVIKHSKDGNSEKVKIDLSAARIVSDAFKELRSVTQKDGKSQWSSATFRLSSDGQFKIDFRYPDK